MCNSYTPWIFRFIGRTKWNFTSSPPSVLRIEEHDKVKSDEQTFQICPFYTDALMQMITLQVVLIYSVFLKEGLLKHNFYS